MPQLRSDLLLCDSYLLLGRRLSIIFVLLCRFSINCFDVPWHFEFIEDELSLDLRFDLTVYTSDLEALVCYFLKCQTPEKLVLYEDLFDAGVGAELE